MSKTKLNNVVLAEAIYALMAIPLLETKGNHVDLQLMSVLNINSERLYPADIEEPTRLILMRQVLGGIIS